jgi:enamine deaminase RidA (YjgF/YER057c/UK114 family)
LSRRQSIYVDEFGHRNPIPAACRIGDTLMSGIVHGLDGSAGTQTLDAQCALMFRRVRAILEAGGGATDDIIKITVWLQDLSQRAPLNRAWEAMFPDPADRPARQAIAADLTDGKLIQCDFVAKITG